MNFGPLTIILKIFLVLFILGVMAASAGLYAIEQDIPNIQSLEDYAPIQGTRIYSDDGHLVAHLATERRAVVSIESIPEHVVHAFLAAEDSSFYEHTGLDYMGILRAAIKNLRPGAHLQGASTITQQTVKTLLVGSERSYMRKMREAVLARQLEQLLSKNDILHLYLNQIYFGSGAYGVERAAQTYFAKSVRDLTSGEAAYLAAIPKNPSRYTIKSNPEAAKQRQRYVLERMEALGWASSEEAQKEIEAPVPPPPPSDPYFNRVPHYIDHVRRLLIEKYGKDKIYGSGLIVYTGLSADLQLTAQIALQHGVENIGRKHGYPGTDLRIEVDRFGLYHETLKETFAAAVKKRQAYKDSAYANKEMIWDLSFVSAKDLADERSLRRRMRLVEATPGQRTTGLVVQTSSSKKAALVDLGSRYGRIQLADVQWARRFSPTGETPPPRDPSELLRQGDLVAVELKPAEAQPTSADAPLALDLLPVVRANGALVAIDPHTRFVRAMVGGYVQRAGGFNRATQALRQPGSAFKPVVYAAGLLDKLITPATSCADSPVVIRDQWTGEAWKPENYEDGRYDGMITYRTALMRSKNTCSVKLVERLGPEPVIEMARKLGITAKLPNNLTIALGTGEVTPIELANAYATIASSGLHADPTLIRKIVDHHGKVIADHRKPPKRVLEESVSFVLTHMMQSVVEEGTAVRARVLGRQLAGKTGTTNESRNTWFAGFSPELVTVVWTGFDDNAPMGKLTGSSAALPIWVDFMQAALKDTPISVFTPPADVVFRRVDADTGEPSEDVGSIEEVFLPGTEPTEISRELPSIFMEDMED